MKIILPDEKRECDFCLNHSEYSFLLVSPNGAICTSCISIGVKTMADKAHELLATNAPAKEKAQ